MSGKLYKEGFISNYGHIITDTFKEKSLFVLPGVSSSGFGLSRRQQPSGSGADPGVRGEQMDGHPERKSSPMSPSNAMESLIS